MKKIKGKVYCGTCRFRRLISHRDMCYRVKGKPASCRRANEKNDCKHHEE